MLASARHVSSASPEIAVEGEVERITFENRETGFRVVKVAVPGRDQRLAIVGTFPSVAVGARVRARGTIEVDRNHGEQLRATSVTELAPSTLAGIEKYLGSGLIKGVGERTAKRIVDTFGLETLRVLDEQPHRLRGVSGLGPARIESLITAWREQRAIRDVMVFLQAHGASPALATRIYKRYGPKAVTIVSADPYRLAIDVWGVGFRTADKIAGSLGTARDSIERMQAALFQALRDATESGHCYVRVRDLVERAAGLVDDDATPGGPGPDVATLERLGEGMKALARGAYVTLERADAIEVVTEVTDEALVWSPDMHATERRLATRLAKLGSTRLPGLRGAQAAVERFEREKGAELAPEQRAALDEAAARPLLVLTGGPGVGKTTVIRAILSMFDAAGVAARLAAPTGRAAKRMTEATGREAVTLHRLLEFDPKTAKFKRDAGNPIDASAIIVDESSMVDVWMADALTQAVPDGARLVLVGDVDQLPSVGPGSFLRDTISSGAVPCVRLTRIFRQGSESLIVDNAHRINAGEPPVVPESGADADFFVIDKRDPDEARRMIVELVTRRIPRRFGLDPVRDIQVLTPMNRGPAGTMALNEALQEALNPSGAGLQRGRSTFRAGDKVMQLRNDYDRNVWNGDVGVVASVDVEEESLVVRFDSGAGARDVPYDGGALDELALAYACTIHKSQGSEYPAVVIPLLTTHFVMLSKNLLYTGVTRGKRLVVVIADPRAMRLALAEDRREQRSTRLAARIQVACGDGGGE